MTLTIPELSSTRTRSRLRSGFASIALTSTGRSPRARGHRSDVEADRHHQVAKVVALHRFEQTWPQRRDQPNQNLVALHAFDPFAEELGVEADLQRLPLEGGRDRLPRVADIRRFCPHGQLTGLERKSQRRVALRQLADAAGDIEEVRAR